MTTLTAPDRLQKRVAALSKSRQPWDPELREARDELKIARIASQITDALTTVTMTPRRALALAAPLLAAAAREPEVPRTPEDVLAALLAAEGARR